LIANVEFRDTYVIPCSVNFFTAYRRKAARSSFGYGGESSREIEAPLAQVSEGLSSSVFEIISPANIPADKSGHKVTGNNA
jgi:hypothetical protein